MSFTASSGGGFMKSIGELIVGDHIMYGKRKCLVVEIKTGDLQDTFHIELFDIENKVILSKEEIGWARTLKVNILDYARHKRYKENCESMRREKKPIIKNVKKDINYRTLVFVLSGLSFIVSMVVILSFLYLIR